uniref:Uncharacterized protein n=1 Tax=Phage sp. ct4bw6 TaxID=2826747 RepID=A0A8S5MUY5_9VIRU|nr:MAG TPA: hypothetical protein [Phage sp. ct4bw6]DAI69772.1 MAG TPA: hypothetical protein [Caudoviricetes sp.]
MTRDTGAEIPPPFGMRGGGILYPYEIPPQR